MLTSFLSISAFYYILGRKKMQPHLIATSFHQIRPNFDLSGIIEDFPDSFHKAAQTRTRLVTSLEFAHLIPL